MLKLSTKLSVVLVIITALILICLQTFDTKPVLSELDGHLNPSISVATAALPPSLETAVLGGKPIYVLYVTRSEDTVLVRCYPGYEPTIKVRSMGSNPNGNTQKEGVMICRRST